MKITVPRFGKVNVTSSINFIDSNNQIKEQNSEPIEFISWPIQLIIIIAGFIYFCVICVLLYKYVIKNMFGRKKKKKENDKYTNSYIVKDTDNIISIAQLHGVPWKDLANINDIEPPYILISGETIKVPGKKENIKKNEEINEEEAVESFENNLDIKSNNQQKNEIENITNNVSDSISKSIDMKNSQTSNNEEKKEVIAKEVEEKKEKKILYASPKNMLTKSSSEPTTRAIDIDWMREDESIYTEEMQTQEKKIKTRFILLSILICVIIGLGLWWGITQFLAQNNQDNVSVDNFIEEKEDLATEEKEESINEDVANITENTPDNTVNSIDENSSKDSNLDVDTSATKAVEDIGVQVLNAGSQVGAAGAVTDEFTKKGYKTSTAQNAKNDYEGVVIYYNENSKESLDDISKLVSEKYGNQVHEESTDVTSKYDVDFVIVLGS